MHLYLVLKLLVFQNTLINYIYHKLLYIKVGGKGQLYPEKVHRNQSGVPCLLKIDETRTLLMGKSVSKKENVLYYDNYSRVY